MKTVVQSLIVNFPQIPPNTASFTFETSNALGTFQFTFKWLNGIWNGWATLPSGEIRPFGCIPDVISWVDFMDFGVFIDSPLPVIALNNLVGKTTLYLLQWGID